MIWTSAQQAVASLGTNSTAVVRVVTVGVGLLAVLTSAEHLAVRERFDEDGLLSWTVMRLFVQTGGPLAPLMERIVRYPYFRGVLVFRLLVAGGLAGLAVAGHVSLALLLLLLGTNVAIGYRHVGGLTGTFQVSAITVPTLIVATAAPSGSLAETAALTFLALQIALSYFVAGVSKLVSREWQTGDALVGIFSTEVYGHEGVFELLRRYPPLKVVGSWTVIAFECLFPIALFVDDVALFAVLGVAVAFHLFNALFMGLNNFLIGFPATYPALIYVNRLVRDLLF